MKPTLSSGWEHLSHGADIGVRGVAATVAGAFEQAALGLTAIVVPPEEVSARDEVEIICEAPDLELLLVDWLNALIYEMATRRMLFGRFEVAIEGTKLQARAWGQPMSELAQEMAVEPKGATYTMLSVGENADGLCSAQCVIDV